MSKGYLWFAQNNIKTDYVELSIKLAESIKKYKNARKHMKSMVSGFLGSQNQWISEISEIH